MYYIDVTFTNGDNIIGYRSCDSEEMVLEIIDEDYKLLIDKIIIKKVVDNG